MNRSLSLVIALAVVVIATVIVSYLDIIDMDRKIAEKNRHIPMLRHSKKNGSATATPTVAEKALHPWSKREKNVYARHFIAKAYLLYHNGQTAAAEEAIKSALLFQPNNINALALLGRIMYESGRYATAEELFKRVANRIRSSSAYNNLAEAMARQGRYPEAIKILNLALEQQPKSITINLNLAGLHALNGDKSKSLFFLQRTAPKLGAKLLPLLYDPSLDNIRQKKIFKKLLRQSQQQQGTQKR